MRDEKLVRLCLVQLQCLPIIHVVDLICHPGKTPLLFCDCILCYRCTSCCCTIKAETSVIAALVRVRLNRVTFGHGQHESASNASGTCPCCPDTTTGAFKAGSVANSCSSLMGAPLKSDVALDTCLTQASRPHRQPFRCHRHIQNATNQQRCSQEPEATRRSSVLSQVASVAAALSISWSAKPQSSALLACLPYTLTSLNDTCMA